jgi:hypothetical protein
MGRHPVNVAVVVKGRVNWLREDNLTDVCVCVAAGGDSMNMDLGKLKKEEVSNQAVAPRRKRIHSNTKVRSLIMVSSHPRPPQRDYF